MTAGRLVKTPATSISKDARTSTVLSDFSMRPKLLLKPVKISESSFFIFRAEAERFELSMPCGMPPFQGGALDHYATPPLCEGVATCTLYQKETFADRDWRSCTNFGERVPSRRSNARTLFFAP